MTWTLGSVRIFVQELNDNAEQVIARLTPLASGTVLQVFGFEYLVKNLKAYVVGQDDKGTLIGYTRDGTTRIVSGLGYSWGDYFVKKAAFNMEMTNCQTLRTDLAEDSPVYIVDLELYKDE